ncbi:MAG: SOS response-associated peptidase [Nitrospinota bacterium]
MCGRFANTLEELGEWKSVLSPWPKAVKVGFNIAPTAMIPAFTKAGGVGMRWGLIPNWSKEISSKYSTFNARFESITTKPAFRHAWFASQRCLIPVLGYFEWLFEQGSKQPCFVRSADGSPLVFGGLYEHERRGSFPASCSIITAPASKEMSKLHPRVPVTIPLENAEQWLHESPEISRELVLYSRRTKLDWYPVKKEVNNSRNQEADLIERLPSGGQTL